MTLKEIRKILKIPARELARIIAEKTFKENGKAYKPSFIYNKMHHLEHITAEQKQMIIEAAEENLQAFKDVKL
jgi:hypothetical protein